MHGYVRATVDIDFFYRRTPENVTRLLAAMQEFGAPPEVLDRAHLEAPDTVTAFGEPPVRIDLLSGEIACETAASMFGCGRCGLVPNRCAFCALLAQPSLLREKRRGERRPVETQVRRNVVQNVRQRAKSEVGVIGNRYMVLAAVLCCEPHVAPRLASDAVTIATE